MNEHTAVVDGRPSDTAFRDDREARAALTAWLHDGAEIIRRCRVSENTINSCRASIAYVAMEALIGFDYYRGIDADPLEYAALGKWVEREIGAECSTERVIEP